MVRKYVRGVKYMGVAQRFFGAQGAREGHKKLRWMWENGAIKCHKRGGTQKISARGVCHKIFRFKNTYSTPHVLFHHSLRERSLWGGGVVLKIFPKFQDPPAASPPPEIFGFSSFGHFFQKQVIWGKFSQIFRPPFGRLRHPKFSDPPTSLYPPHIFNDRSFISVFF